MRKRTFIASALLMALAMGTTVNASQLTDKNANDLVGNDAAATSSLRDASWGLTNRYCPERPS